MAEEQLSVKQTATGYWIVQRGSVELAGAVTRRGAEAERDLLKRLGARNSQLRVARRSAALPQRQHRP